MRKSIRALSLIFSFAMTAHAADDCAKFPALNKVIATARRGVNTNVTDIHEAMKSALAQTTMNDYWEAQTCVSEARQSAKLHSELDKTAHALLLEYLTQNDQNMKRLAADMALKHATNFKETQASSED